MRDFARATESAGAPKSVEEPWELPKGWCWAALSDLGAWTSGGTPKSTELEFYDGSVPWFRISDLNEGKLRASEKSITAKWLNASSAKIISAPFLMFAMYGASIGKMAISEIDATTNQAIACCRPNRCINIDYMFWGLQRLKQTIIALGQGGARPNISQKILLERMFPLAPLAEQRRIVARIDALFSEIADGEAALAEARKGLDLFRRALLKAAVTGELTKDWRKENLPLETGAEVLRRVKAKRLGLNFVSPDNANSTMPREGWAWTTIDDLSEFITSGSRGWKDYYAPVGAMFVRAQNINSGRLDLCDVAHVNLPANAEGLRTRLRVDDVLVTITGANVTVSARVDEVIEEAYVNQHVALIRLLEPELSSFVLLWLQADGAGRTQLEKAAYGAGKPRLNLENIKRVQLALPPPEKSREIIRLVSETLAAADDTLKILDTEAADVARLKRSILKAAFEGRLVAQDPSDEPASAMLARLGGGAKPSRSRTKRNV